MRVTTVGNRMVVKGRIGYHTGGSGAYGKSTVGSLFISSHDGCYAIPEQSTFDNIIHTGQSIHYRWFIFY